MTGGEGVKAAFRGRLGAFGLDVALDVPSQGITALFGPSGSGKTTTLRCIAGLQRLEGTCHVGGEVWQDRDTFLPTHRRPIGYVFQEPSLFPHLSVRQNLLFPARAAGKRRPPARIGFDDVVALLDLSGLLARAPDRLSGGERQRVAIGRALLSEPRLMLMDEPLSALDRDRREEIMPFLERLHGSLGMPILIVTHEMATVERLADHLVLIDGGRIRASGPLHDIQSDPGLPLALSRDAAVSFEATVSGHDAAYGLARLDVDGGTFVVPASRERLAGVRLRLRVAAGDVSLTLSPPADTTILNVMPARILEMSPSGEHEVIVVLGLGQGGGGQRMLARITRLSRSRLGLREGMEVYAQVKGVALARRS